MAGLYGDTAPSVAVELVTGYAGAFVLGTSLLGSTDTLGRGVPTWAEVPCDDLIGVGIRRGRTREDQAVQPGTLDVSLDNITGDYDPDNTDSPWRSGGFPLLMAGTEIRVRATWQTVDYLLFRGFVEAVSADMGDTPRATVSASDGLAWLGRRTLPDVGPVWAGDTSSARVGHVLDAVDWPAAARSLTGSRTLLPVDRGGVALALVDEAATVEAGRLWATREGTITLTPYEAMWTAPYRFALSDAAADGLVGYDTIRTAPGAKYLTNTVTVEFGDAKVTATNTASVSRWGVYPATVRAPFADASQAQAVAQLLADRNAEPVTRVERIEFDAPALDAALWPALLACDLGDQVRVDRTTRDGRAHVWTSLAESVGHDISGDAWRVGLDLSPARRAGTFILGDSLLGGTHTLWY